MSSGTERVLGLDLGTNSIGWALTEERDGEPKGLIDLGARIFEMAIEAKTKTPKNAARRAARGARRLTKRRKMRRQQLTHLFQTHGLLPTDQLIWDKLFHDHAINPYELRTRALDEKLHPHEIGRALFHLNQRRGYQSNRRSSKLDQVEDSEVRALVLREEKEELEKAQLAEEKRRAKALEKGKDYKAKEEDESAMLVEIANLSAALGKPGARTLGEYLCRAIRDGGKARTVHTDRQMYKDEFDAIWESQKTHYRHLLTDGLKAQAFSTIFFQRPLKSQSGNKGKCEFETGRNRAPKGHPDTQRFRILQDAVHMLYRSPKEQEFKPLDDQQLKSLVQALHEQKSMTWASVKKTLGLPKGAVINLEEGGKDKLVGNVSEIELKERTNGRWTSLSDGKDGEKEALLTDLLTIDRKDSLVNRLRKTWNFSPREAYDLATLELPTGTASLSLKAIRKIMPHLAAGNNYHDACQAAGYLRPDQRNSKKLNRLEKAPDLRNPVVNRALSEVRHLVNAIIAVYGVPDRVTIEMARDLSLSEIARENLRNQNRENEKLNIEAEEKLHNIGIQRPSVQDKIKYRLWVECNGICPYTGKPIPIERLFTNDIDVEHILPYSRSLDDSFNNKTLCYADENRNIKRNRTPWEAYGDTLKWDEIYSRVKGFIKHTYRKLEKQGKTKAQNIYKAYTSRHKEKQFAKKEIPKGFSTRQLNDTRYISRQVLGFLGQLGCDVQVSKGEATAALRHRWGLNSILGEDGKKNRDDHRHHAIDALVVALTSRPLFQKITALSKDKSGGLWHGEWDLDLPWTGFRNDVQKRVDNVIVSHQINRRISGALHQDTAYGWSETAKKFVFRKPVADLKKAEIERIRDPKVRALIQALVEKKGEDGLKEPLFITNKYGENKPIKSVRLFSYYVDKTKHVGVKDAGGKDFKYHLLGSNHHALIYRDPKTGKSDADVVPMFEVAQRTAKGESVYFVPENRRKENFVFVLHAGDTVLVEGDHHPYVIRMLSPAKPIMIKLQLVNDASDAGELMISAVGGTKGLDRVASKIRIDRLGRVWPDK